MSNRMIVSLGLLIVTIINVFLPTNFGVTIALLSANAFMLGFNVALDIFRNVK